MPREGWVRKKSMAPQDCARKLPLLTVCPVLWEAALLATLQAIFAVLAREWVTNSGEMPKPARRVGNCCLKGKGKAGRKSEIHEDYTASCYHQEQHQAAFRKSSSCAWVCSHPSLFLPLRVGKGGSYTFLTRKISCDKEEKNHVTKKKKATLQSFQYFYFFTFSHLFFLASSLV